MATSRPLPRGNPTVGRPLDSDVHAGVDDMGVGYHGGAFRATIDEETRPHPIDRQDETGCVPDSI